MDAIIDPAPISPCRVCLTFSPELAIFRHTKDIPGKANKVVTQKANKVVTQTAHLDVTGCERGLGNHCTVKTKGVAMTLPRENNLGKRQRVAAAGIPGQKRMWDGDQSISIVCVLFVEAQCSPVERVQNKGSHRIVQKSFLLLCWLNVKGAPPKKILQILWGPGLLNDTTARGQAPTCLTRGML